MEKMTRVNWILVTCHYSGEAGLLREMRNLIIDEIISGEKFLPLFSVDGDDLK